MDDCFKDWIEEVVKVTGLDRNQVIRLALFSAPFSDEFKKQINKRRDFDVNLPSPAWSKDSDGGPWRRSEWIKEERGDDVRARIKQEGAKSVVESVRIVEPGEPERESDVTGNATSHERRKRKIYQPETPKPKINIPPPLTKTRKAAGKGIRINIG
jgi:hypothetical protein